ncbi:MAG TPA: hypothetical protein VGK24_07085 [Candidatus Angelobacter sp.]
MATVKNISTAEAMRMAAETASHQLERIRKETGSISEQYALSGIENIQRMQHEAEKLGYGVAPLIRDLEQQMTTFNCGITDRLKDLAFPGKPNDIAAVFDSLTALEHPLNKIPSFSTESILAAARAPYETNPIAPADMRVRLQPVTDRFGNLGDVVEASMVELGERVEQRLKADAAASQAQMMQLANMIDTLVKITASSSQESAAATRRNTRLAIIMTIAAICQCLIPLLMRYFLK